MSDTIKFDNIGYKALYENLLKLEKTTTQKRVLQKALVEAAEPMAEKAAAAAPVLEGDLQKSIGVGTKLTDRGRKAAPPLPEDKFRVNAYVGSDSRIAPEATLVEYGTKERVQKTTGRETGSVTPQPFMRPAFYAEAKPTLDRLAAIAERLITAAVDRQARRNAKRGK